MVLGNYYLRRFQRGLGDHVCYCGHMVAGKAWGSRVATAPGEHSQATARSPGHNATQHCFVVSTHEQAVRLWRKLGMKMAGRLAKAHQHARPGYVDALGMYRWLAASP